MNTKIKLKLLALATIAACFSGCVTSRQGAGEHDAVTQVSTYDALALGLYDGGETVESLLPYGDFGLGTLHGWNGEVVVLDGKHYLIDGAGEVRQIKDFSATTPFLEVKWFKAEMSRPLLSTTTYEQLKQSPARLLPSVNVLYAVKIAGTFQHVKTRSMPTQSKPYKPMSELIKTQPTFEFENVEGTMVGFWSPPSMKGVALAGWHLHFITKDHRGGGHVLEFTSRDAVMQLDHSREFRWLIPDTKEYQETSF